MRKTTLVFFSVLLIVSLFSFEKAAVADDDTFYDPLQTTLPIPLTPQLSADGNTLYNGLPLLAVVDDPNPSIPLRRIPAPAGISDQPEAATASFSITYIPNGGADLWGEPCYTFPEEAKTDFNYAANIWANTLSSDVPITINACWADLGSSSTLGYSGGGPLHRDFTGATRSNTWYVGSLANAQNGSDLDPSKFDMHITYNRNFEWYYGTDGNPPSTQHDLVTVVLHEICHGLNFSGSMSYSGGSGSWGYDTGYPNIYDVFIKDGSGTQLIDTGTYPNGSAALGSVLTSNDIWFHGSQAMAANGNQRVKMYAPSTWSSGSSYSHLDYDTFNNTPNQLMVYAISAGESVHDPGAVTRGLLEDLGWTAGTTSNIYVDPSGHCGGKVPCYTTIQEAVNDASTGTTIKIAGGIYGEDVSLHTDKDVVFEGGYDSTFTTQSSETIFQTMTINNGRAVVDKLILGSTVPRPNISYSGSNPYDYGTVEVGSSLDHAFTIQNTGSATLNISGASVSGTGFSVVGSVPSSIAAAGSDTITVRFTPGSVGSHTGTLSINSDDPDTPVLNIGLNGEGGSEPQQVASAVFYNALTCGGSFTATLTIDGQVLTSVSGVYSDCEEFECGVSLNWNLDATSPCGTITWQGIIILDCDCLYEFVLFLADDEPALGYNKTCPGDCSDVPSVSIGSIKLLDSVVVPRGATPSGFTVYNPSIPD